MGCKYVWHKNSFPFGYFYETQIKVDSEINIVITWDGLSPCPIYCHIVITWDGFSPCPIYCHLLFVVYIYIYVLLIVSRELKV